MIKRYLAIILTVFIIAGCTNAKSVQSPKTTYYTPEYIFNLTSVKIGKDNSIKGIDSQNLRFQDENILISFKTKHKYFNFELLNKSNETIKLHWNEIVYVGYDGSSQGVINSNIRFINKGDNKQPSNIISNSKLEEKIIPTNNVVYLYDEWFIRDMLAQPGKDSGTFNTSDYNDANNVGASFINKKIIIMIPIEKGNKTLEYYFNFEIINHKVVEYNKTTY